VRTGTTSKAPVPRALSPGVAWNGAMPLSRYVIEARLAAGGMADIWRAQLKGAEGFEKTIVVKTMLFHLQHRAELVKMFVNEATVAARLSHPHIVQVFDFGQLEGRYFIAMEYVPGPTLRQAGKTLRARGQRLPRITALRVLAEICEALHHIHELRDAQGPLGLVHRDISPDNVILSSGGMAKLLDFGAARATNRTPPNPVFVGKYRYAAPERIRYLREDLRSDIFSAGVVLYECLAGARPFEGDDAAVIAAIAAGRARDLRERVPDLPEAVLGIVGRAMAFEPAARYQSAGDMACDLRAAADELGAARAAADPPPILLTDADIEIEGDADTDHEVYEVEILDS
jgi:serine/threonine protein kinase